MENQNIILVFGLLTAYIPLIAIYLILCLIIPKKDDIIVIKNKRTIEKENIEKIHNMVTQINEISNRILEKDKNNKLVGNVIKEFKDKIIEFKKYSPKLEKQYLECMEYIKENEVEHLRKNIQSLNEKIDLTSGKVQSNYVSILEQTENRIIAVSDIKEYIDVIESKLILILSTLQNIDVNILQAELKTTEENPEYEELQSQISILSENITDMSDIFKKSKIKI